MSHSHEDEPFSDDLQHVADVLRDERPTLDPVALDRVKLRAMSAASRSNSSASTGSVIRQRLTTVLAAGFLAIGTGGTLALAGVGGGNGAGSASFSQYKPPCVHGKGQGFANECPGEKAGKGGQGKGKAGGKGGKAGKGKGVGGHGGNGGGHNGKAGGGHRGGNGKGSHGSKGGTGRGKNGHGKKAGHQGKAGHGRH